MLIPSARSCRYRRTIHTGLQLLFAGFLLKGIEKVEQPLVPVKIHFKKSDLMSDIFVQIRAKKLKLLSRLILATCGLHMCSTHVE